MKEILIDFYYELIDLLYDTFRVRVFKYTEYSLEEGIIVNKDIPDVKYGGLNIMLEYLLYRARLGGNSYNYTDN